MRKFRALKDCGYVRAGEVVELDGYWSGEAWLRGLNGSTQISVRLFEQFFIGLI